MSLISKWSAAKPIFVIIASMALIACGQQRELCIVSRQGGDDISIIVNPPTAALSIDPGYEYEIIIPARLYGATVIADKIKAIIMRPTGARGAIEKCPVNYLYGYIQFDSSLDVIDICLLLDPKAYGGGVRHTPLPINGSFIINNKGEVKAK